LVDDADISMVVEDKKSWFTRMEVFDQIYDQLIFSTNDMRCQPITSQYVQPLAAQNLALAATGIHCALTEYASGLRATVMFSPDEY